MSRLDLLSAGVVASALAIWFLYPAPTPSAESTPPAEAVSTATTHRPVAGPQRSDPPTKPTERPMTPSTVRDSLPTLDLERTGATLELRVHNTSRERIWLMTPLERYDKRQRRWVVDRRRVYVGSSGPLLAVELSKRIWPLPTGVHVYRPESPRATPLEPGEDYTEQVSLTRLRIDHPYRWVRTSRPQGTPPTRSSRELRFTLGYIQEAAGVRFSKVGDGVYRFDPIEGLAAQRFVEASLATRVTLTGWLTPTRIGAAHKLDSAGQR